MSEVGVSTLLFIILSPGLEFPPGRSPSSIWGEGGLSGVLASVLISGTTGAIYRRGKFPVFLLFLK